MSQGHELPAAGGKDTPTVRLPASSDFLSARSVKVKLLEEQRAGWEAGKPLRLEDLLARWPSDPGADADAASLLFEEHCQRRRLGEQAAPEELEHRFPAQKGSLAKLSLQQELLRSLGGEKCGRSMLLALPSAGDELFGFQLCRELGRGSFARVFLAEQKALAGRPVVVKVSAIDGDEPQTLAQLQHTNIVPIYSAHEDGKTGLRVVCMPYFGGAALARVLQAVWAGGECPTRGRQLVEALQVIGGVARPESAKGVDGTATTPVEESGHAPAMPETGFLPHLAELSYVRASAWILARLAEALHHAHERGILHRDIKPSNVLLGADGQPMLLDFNLSQNVTSEQAKASAALGGTVAYMAPEHLRALASRDPALGRQVDQRADIYGLGMVLYEMLTGRRPFDQSGSYSPMPALMEAMAVERGRAAPSLRAQRQDVSWSLESISRKCLAPEPADRYQHADALAEDLRRFLEDQPLRHAPELSQKERVAKFVRRHPRLTQAGALVSAAVLLLAVGAGILTATRAQLHTVQARAHEAEGAEARERKQNFAAGAERARCLVNTTTGVAGQTREGVEVCEQTLALYGILETDDWQRHAAWQRLDPEDRLALAEDVRELLLLLAWGKVFLTSNQGHAANGTRVALETALSLLDRAEAIPDLESSSALWHDRAVYLEKLGDSVRAAEARSRAEATAPTGPRDHYLLATAYARERRTDEALTQLKRALELNPRHYWSLFQLGMLHESRGEHAFAYGAFSACIHLWPEFAWGYFNRGRVLQQLGHSREAIADYTACLTHDPGLAIVYFNRGLLYLDLQQAAQALADFDAAANFGWDKPALHSGRGIALEQLHRFAEADAAFERWRAGDPDNSDALLGYGFAVSERLPEKAWAAFEKVLAQNRANPRALYGCAMLLQRRSRQSEYALAYFNLALQADPTFVAARRARANVLAHRGDADQARQDIDWCVKAEPTGVTLYAAACVYALIADKAPDAASTALTDRAVQLLREAFERGYGMDRAAADKDLAPLHGHADYRRLLRQTTQARAQQRGQ